MNIEDTQLIEALNEATKELGLDCVSPYEVELKNGDTIVYLALIKEFGSPKGTLICSRSVCPEGYSEEYKYFVSVLSHDYYFPYHRTDYIEMLQDWGWFGEDFRKPSWL